jgi:uncharacterized protein YciI
MKRIQLPIMATLKIQFVAAIAFFAILSSFKASAQEVNKNYDEKLAKELKADDYGMKRYVLVILKTGTVTNLPKATQDSIFTGHMANISRLAAEGKLVVAGPLGKNDKSYRGIFIFDVDDIEAAKKLVNTDPVILSKLMDAEYYPWYGSAALKETLKIHSKIEKKGH